ncbi:DUF6157 family protein [Cohnella candidum]|uniref:Uncharacterized protein n=1 Tax=Cohnella candidum TaxID=2674991 RepID=A0A3G3K2Y0_9BACL|nr:DUF6157 family protein [Cohnella candidum]AYQ74856.1 hypothetical protein EAV92_21260 [Cohnella candidum]
MEWNYYDTFITVAPDCPAEYGIAPPDKKSGKTKPGIEFELVAEQPYVYTQEELLFEVHARHKGIPEEEFAEHKEEFYKKPTACMRASMLPKKYGWGIHFNAEGKLALIPRESPEYQRFLAGEVENVKIVPAMRNSRK